MLEASAISEEPMEMAVFAAGGQMLTTIRTRTAAKAPVTTKVHTRLLTGYMRLNAACPRSILQQAMKQLRDAVDSYK